MFKVIIFDFLIIEELESIRHLQGLPQVFKLLEKLLTKNICTKWKRKNANKEKSFFIHNFFLFRRCEVQLGGDGKGYYFSAKKKKPGR